MARRSILTPAREERFTPPDGTVSPEPGGAQGPVSRPGRAEKLHIGGYFDPADPTIIAFQKLKIDLRCSQQDMLLEALRDFVAKHEAASAFR